MLSCIHHEKEYVNGNSSLVALSWELEDKADNFSLTFTPSPPSLTPPLTIITYTTTVTLTLLSDVNYTLEITTKNCVGGAVTNFSIGMKVYVRLEVI